MASFGRLTLAARLNAGMTDQRTWLQLSPGRWHGQSLLQLEWDRRAAPFAAHRYASGGRAPRKLRVRCKKSAGSFLLFFTC